MVAVIRRTIVLVALGALLASAAACGPTTAEAGTAEPSPTATPPPGDRPPRTPRATYDDATAPQRATETTSAETEDPTPGRVEEPSPKDRPSPSATAQPTAGGDLAITLAVTPDCVRPGSAVTVTIGAEPESGLSMAIGFADGHHHGAMNIATADAAGRHVWDAPVSPDVPPGTATVVVAGGSEDGERSGWARGSFVVAGVEGCR